MRNDKENIIVDKAIEFSLSIISYVEELEQNKKYVVANQLLRSATSIGANICEAQNAESRVDFVHKMKIAAKEASETLYWLTLCEKSKNYNFKTDLKIRLDEVIRILSKIISSSKSKVIVSIFGLIANPFSNYQIIKLAH